MTLSLPSLLDWAVTPWLIYAQHLFAVFPDMIIVIDNTQPGYEGMNQDWYSASAAVDTR